MSNCDNCKLRAKYDNAPRSLLGRFWKWHISWCPGWKNYLKSLSQEECDRLRKLYGVDS